jgi:hypothetical protein
MKNKLIIFLFLMISYSLFAVDINVTGVVKDKQGNPLPGANVTIKGTTISTLTDMEGKYNINCSVGDELIFSFADLKSKIVKVENKTVIDISWQIFDRKTLGAIIGIIAVSSGWLIIYFLIL